MNPNFVPNGLHHVGNCIRPPSEANAILLQATLGCSHSKCTFCGAYSDKRFALKERKYLEGDFEFAKKYCRHQDQVFVMEAVLKTLDQALASNIDLKPEWMRGL